MWGWCTRGFIAGLIDMRLEGGGGKIRGNLRSETRDFLSPQQGQQGLTGGINSHEKMKKNKNTAELFGPAAVQIPLFENIYQQQRVFRCNVFLGRGGML